MEGNSTAKLTAFGTNPLHRQCEQQQSLRRESAQPGAYIFTCALTLVLHGGDLALLCIDDQISLQCLCG